MPTGWETIRVKVESKVQQSIRNYTPVEMMKTLPFYVLYFMMTIVAFGGLMVTAQLKPIGSSYGYDKVVLFTGGSALSLALMLDRNGFTRPFWGWISDHIGRYNTMALAFFMEGCAIMFSHRVYHRIRWHKLETAGRDRLGTKDSETQDPFQHHRKQVM